MAARSGLGQCGAGPQVWEHIGGQILSRDYSHQKTFAPSPHPSWPLSAHLDPSLPAGPCALHCSGHRKACFPSAGQQEVEARHSGWQQAKAGERPSPHIPHLPKDWLLDQQRPWGEALYLLSRNTRLCENLIVCEDLKHLPTGALPAHLNMLAPYEHTREGNRDQVTVRVRR